MTVKELIEKLNCCQQDAEVIQVDGHGYEFEVNAVDNDGEVVYLREN